MGPGARRHRALAIATRAPHHGAVTAAERPDAPDPPRVSRRSAWLTALVSLLVVLAGLELAFRAAGFDFEFKRRALERTPIFYRRPLVPLGDGFMRRPGPAVWEGPVLAWLLQRRGVPRAHWPDESGLIVRYDAEGFRNAEDLDDWVVVVAGDSCTELGHLPDEALFTSVASRALGVPIKNLGVSTTGPLSYVRYLRDFGGAPSARHAVLTFFEGNDLEDLARELASRRAGGAAGGAGSLREVAEAFAPQSSLALACVRAVRAALSPREPFRPDATYASPAGDVGVSLHHRPPRLDSVDDAAWSHLGFAFDRWRETAAALGLEPWLLYLPAKQRALHGGLRFDPTADAEAASWRPDAFPERVLALAEEHGLRPIDATPALRRAARTGPLPYSALADTHLSATGSRAVGERLARSLRSVLAR